MDCYLPPFGQDPNGRANRRLVAQAPGRKGAFVPDASERRRVDTKPLTTTAPLPVWGTRQGIALSDRGDPGLAPPGWFGHGLLTRPSSATAFSDRCRVTWRPPVGRTAGSGDSRLTKCFRGRDPFLKQFLILILILLIILLLLVAASS